MTKGESFFKNAKCKHGHRSAMSNSTWCDLKKDCTVLKLMICVIILNVTDKSKLLLFLNNFNLKVVRLKVSFKKFLSAHNMLGKKFPKPAINATAPFIAIVVSAKKRIQRLCNLLQIF